MNREDQFVDVVADDFHIRAAERSGHHRAAAEGRDVDIAGDQHLGQLGGAGNEDDLIFQAFFGEEAGVAGDPDSVYAALIEL